MLARSALSMLRQASAGAALENLAATRLGALGATR